MKFYKRFPGDINIKTGHLTPAEMGCYDRLLDHYYATEAPIPTTGAYSICRAVTRADQAACDRVLGQFFRLTGAGWEQQRAEEEIAEALPRIEAARENGKKGGRPPKQKPSGFSEETQSEPNGKTSQIPDTSLRSVKVSKASPSHPPGGGRFPEFWQAWPKNDRKQDKKACAAKWTKEGLDALADTILADVRAKRGTRKWAEGFIEAPLVYLNNRRWEDGGDEGGEPLEAWHETPKGVIAKGVELGLGPWSEADWAAGKVPDYLTYRARVFKAAGHSPRAAA